MQIAAPRALQHAFDVATVETIQRNNDSTKNSLAKMKSSSISLGKTEWLRRNMAGEAGRYY